MTLKAKTLSGLTWTLAQQFSTQGVRFIVSIVLARVLLPEEFGLIGMITVFVAIGNALINSGFTNSLIRSMDPDEEDYSTVFFFNLAGSVVVYFLMFFLASYIAIFFKQDALVPIIRVYCLSFIVYGFSEVQMARLTKEMDFKTQMIISIPSLIGGSLVGIIMAYKGFGVWSLVWMALVQSVLNTIQLWWKAKWRPRFVFSKPKFKTHFSFGYKLTVSGLLNTIFDNLYLITIGRFFSAAQMGFYTRADSLKQLPVSNISNALNMVTFPLFASFQTDDLKLKQAYKQIMQMVIFVIAPVLVFLGLLAKPLFRLLFTEKWLPAVPYFQVMCIAGILYPVHAYNLNVLLVKGRSDLYLKLEVIKKILIGVSIAAALPFGIMGLVWSQVVISVVAFFINTHYTGRILGYSAVEQAWDILPILFWALLSGAVVYSVDYMLNLNSQVDVVRIVLSGMSGLCVFLFCAWLRKSSSFLQIKSIVFR